MQRVKGVADHFRDCKSVHVTMNFFLGVYQSAYGASFLLKEKNCHSAVG
jgi:hypothetical protein